VANSFPKPDWYASEDGMVSGENVPRRRERRL
jgi:hypothetical protein